MKFRINKAALSIATAVMMVTSMLPMFTGSAAAANEITLSADKSTYTAGERIDVSVGLDPDETGAAGFTLNLHYDPEKVSVHIPTASEAATKYNVGSAFSVITNYTHSEGVVRLVGANLTGGNITSYTNLGLASFDVKSSAKGSIDFWVDVETLVYSTDTGYANAQYSAPGVTVNEYVETTTTTTTTAPATTAPPETTTPAPETTTEPEPVVTTAPEVTEPEETTTEPVVTTTEPVTEEIPEETTTVEETSAPETEPAETEAPVTEPEPETTTAAPEPEGIVIEPEASDTPKPEQTDAIFAYTQTGGDFNSETDVYYVIPVRQLIEDVNGTYDLRVSVQASGNANGGIGMMVGGQWEQAAEKLRSPEEQVWVIRNIEPSKLNSDIVVALFYLKDNCEFRINDIEFERVEARADAPAPAETPEPAEVNEPAQPEEPSAPAAAEEQKQDEEPQQPSEPAQQEQEANSEEPVAEQVIAAEEAPSENNEEAPGAEAVIGEEQSETPTENNASETISEQGAEEEPASTSTAEDVENAVVRAQQAAGEPEASGSNPDTGEGSTARVLIMVVCGAYILWSLSVLIYNRASSGRSKKN